MIIFGAISRADAFIGLSEIHETGSSLQVHRSILAVSGAYRTVKLKEIPILPASPDNLSGMIRTLMLAHLHSYPILSLNIWAQLL
jgi:hypothetical protein